MSSPEHFAAVAYRLWPNLEEHAMTQPTPADGPTVHALVTEVIFSALPDDHPDRDLFEVKVAWRGRDRYAVLRRSRCLGRDGTWDYESIPSERTDDWIATHRFAYDEALKLAHQACQGITVNGHTVADVLERAATR